MDSSSCAPELGCQGQVVGLEPLELRHAADVALDQVDHADVADRDVDQGHPAVDALGHEPAGALVALVAGPDLGLAGRLPRGGSAHRCFLPVRLVLHGKRQAAAQKPGRNASRRRGPL
jgi:hypothetical protein